MAALNGVTITSPPPTTASTSARTPGKRKRGDVDSQAQTRPNGDVKRRALAAKGDQNAWLPSFLADLLELMRRHDTSPSLLDFPIPSPAESPADSDKKAEAAQYASIASKITALSYSSLDQVLSDVTTASSFLIAKIRGKDVAGTGNTPTRPPHPDTESTAVASIRSFKTLFADAIFREKMQRPSLFDKGGVNGTTTADEPEKVEKEINTNRIVVDDDSLPTRAVLTLFGGAPQPKQLFSSLQKPAILSSDSSAGLMSPRAVAAKPLNEAALPNGVSATRVIPIQSIEDQKEKKHVPTIGDLFPPPPTISQLIPPSKSKNTITRGSVVSFYQPPDPNASNKLNRRTTYTNQPLSVGQSLVYNAMPPRPDVGSAETKRKQREGDSDTGDSKPALPLAVQAAYDAAKEEALFRRAYSSFAPSWDDSAAVVPEVLKNRIWWSRFQSPGPANIASVATVPEVTPVDEDMESNIDPNLEISEDAIEAWVPEDPPEDVKVQLEKNAEQEKVDKDVEQVLQDISELLETLNSYQRVRNLALTRSTVGQSQSLTMVAPNPITPSTAEMDIYKMLKSQLSVLISTLPPYAVAKLDGDQLRELNISTKIFVEGKDYRGVMEEDEVVVRARAAATLTAAGTAVQGSPYQQRPYTATATRNPQIPQSPYHQAGTPTRAPASARGTSAAGGSSQAAYNPASRATPYVQSPYTQVPRPATASQYGSQASTTSGQYFQQPGYSYTSQYQTPAHAAGPYQRPSQPQYQQTAQRKAGYVSSPYGTGPAAASTTSGRSASPQKAAAAALTQTPHQRRPSIPYTQQTPQQRQYFQTQSTPAPAAPPVSNVTSTGFHTYMTAEQQALMMERQRAQLAATAHQRMLAQQQKVLQDQQQGAAALGASAQPAAVQGQVPNGVAAGAK